MLKETIMKITIVLCLLLMFNELYSQESRFDIGILGSIGISDRMFISDGTIPDGIKDQFSKTEKPKLGFEFGVLVEYKVSNSIGIQSGMRYVEWGYKSEKRVLDFGFPNPSTGVEIQSGSINQYIELPMKFIYYLNSEKSRWFFNIGYFPSINLKNYNTSKLFSDSGTEKTKEEDTSTSYRGLNLIGEIGIGWEKTLSQKLSLFINPTFKIQSFGISSNAALNRRLLFYGVSIGVKTKVE